MTDKASEFRDLHERLADYEGVEVLRDVFEPWLTESHVEQQELTRFLSQPVAADAPPTATYDDLWRLYALSRVSQFLILRFQSGMWDSSVFQGLEITVPTYVQIMTRLGLFVQEPAAFHPFDCEVVRVEQTTDPAQLPRIIGTLWPSVTAGSLLIERAGVCVSAGTDHMVKSIAETSTLYWAHRRKNRPYQDESHGWGSNSQWRTAFRRDYRIDGTYLYNVDGELNPRNPDPDKPEWPPGNLTVDERIELLTHRCFIKTAKAHDDLYPYEDTLRVG